jgi:hypothetical protein
LNKKIIEDAVAYQDLVNAPKLGEQKVASPEQKAVIDGFFKEAATPLQIPVEIEVDLTATEEEAALIREVIGNPDFSIETPEEYEKYARLTLTEAADIPEHMSQGLVTEAAEIFDMDKKLRYYKKPIDDVNLLEELGDNAWYLIHDLRLRHRRGYPIPTGIWTWDQPKGAIKGLAKIFGDLSHSLMSLTVAYHDIVTGFACQPHGEVVEQRGMQELQFVVQTLNQLAFMSNHTWASIWTTNIKKLVGKRYRGKFKYAEAITRDLDGERQLLEDQATKGTEDQ